MEMKPSDPGEMAPLDFKATSLKVFRCGPRHDIGGQELSAHVDKPRKEEAAGVLDRAMGKVRRGLGQQVHQVCD